jgi:hypothetical protein
MLQHNGPTVLPAMQIGPIEIEATWPTMPDMDLSTMPPSETSHAWLVAVICVVLLVWIVLFVRALAPWDDIHSKSD